MALRDVPPKAWILMAALGTFVIVVGGILAWASLSGNAGAQRGLVIHNELPVALLVSLGPQEARIEPGRGKTLVVKRAQFPARLQWRAEQANGAKTTEVRYQDLVDAEFRLSIDENGIYPTTDYRDTPVPTP